MNYKTTLNRAPGRNGPCRHTSGIKYKKYCMGKQENKSVISNTLKNINLLVQKAAGLKLLLKDYSFDKEITRENLLKFSQEFDVPSERIRLENWTDSREEHLELHNQLDIALGIFLYKGATTTCEALWMDVPVITLIGQHASRVTWFNSKNYWNRNRDNKFERTIY